MSASTLPQNLTHRLAEGKLPVSEALRIATQLAEALRKLHDTGRVHGALSPSSVTFTAGCVELISADASPAVTAYTAPEAIAGTPPDIASDVFSYGAVLYEMLTGRRAFDGACTAEPASTGSPAVDRLMAACLSKDPSVRPPRMQKIILELKMLSMVAKRADQPAQRRDTALEAALRTEIAQLEARLDRRLESQRQEVAASHRDTADTLSGLRGELGGIAVQLEAAQQHSALSQQEVRAAGEKVIAHVQQHLDASTRRVERLEQKLADAGVNHQHLQQIDAAIAAIDRRAASADRVEQIARSLESHLARAEKIEAALVGVQGAFERHKDAADSQASQLAHSMAAQHSRAEGLEKAIAALSDRLASIHKLVAEDVRNLENTIRGQAASTETLRTAVSQSDDLLERVVEALESLQTSALGHNDREIEPISPG